MSRGWWSVGGGQYHFFSVCDFDPEVCPSPSPPPTLPSAHPLSPQSGGCCGWTAAAPSVSGPEQRVRYRMED